MKRLLATVLVLVVVITACGEPDRRATPAADDPGAASGANADEAMDPTAGTTITVAIFDLNPRESDPTDSEAAEAAIATSFGPTPTPYPMLPPFPDVTSCEHAADMTIELFQILLDALVDVSEEVAWEIEEGPPNFQRFLAEFKAQMATIREQEGELECSDFEQTILFLERIDRLHANNPKAEVFIESFRPFVPVTGWTVTTCEDAADVFIARTQARLDLIARAEEHGPSEMILYFYRYSAEMRQLHSDLHDIGCSEDGVTALIGDRLDVLVPQGWRAEDTVVQLRRAVANNRVFDEYARR